VIVAVHPVPPPEGVLDGIELAAASVLEMPDLGDPSRAMDADLLLVELGEKPMRRLREINRITEDVGVPVVVLISADQLVLMESAPGVADFLTTPADPVELRLRLVRLSVSAAAEDVVTFKDLQLNVLTYQATLAGIPVDLTYMEWELLRFLVENPVRVWSREQLLSKVWGYDYYGGARTVDVHVRRLRSKLGEERSRWITTVRSVGYRFG
jgi:DNA-binding response OmpR family regulator